MLIAVTQVRNEVRLLPLTVANLLQQGVDVILVADHGSTDGTSEWLAEQAGRDTRVQWVRNSDPAFHQSEAITLLSRVAAAAGAAWVLPFDADEFWIASDEQTTIAQVLACCEDAGALQVRLEDFPPPRDIDRFSAELLPRYQYRALGRPETVDPRQLTGLAAGKHSFIPHATCVKWLVRTTPDVRIDAGAHSVTGEGTGVRRRSAEIRVLHLPVLDRGELEDRRQHGARLRASGYSGDHGWQQQLMLRVGSEAQMNAFWMANSIGPEGVLGRDASCDEVVLDRSLDRLSTRLQRGVPPNPEPTPQLVHEHLLGQGQRALVTAQVTRAELDAARSDLDQVRRTSAEAVESRMAAARDCAEQWRLRHASVMHRLDAALAELEVTAGELERVRRTRSWRVPQPLRILLRTDDAASQLRRKAESEIRQIEWAEPLVDRDWYLACNPDVAAMGIDPVRHFALYGYREGRLPAPTTVIASGDEADQA